MRFYAARVRKDSPGFTVSFPDVPEALTCGDTKEEALLHARDAVESALSFYIESQRAVPVASPPKRGQHAIELTAGVEAVLLLYTELLRQGVSRRELGKRMKRSPRVIDKLLDVIDPPSIDAIATALAALGKRLEVTLQ